MRAQVFLRYLECCYTPQLRKLSCYWAQVGGPFLGKGGGLHPQKGFILLAGTGAGPILRGGGCHPQKGIVLLAGTGANQSYWGEPEIFGAARVLWKSLFFWWQPEFYGGA